MRRVPSFRSTRTTRTVRLQNGLGLIHPTAVNGLCTIWSSIAASTLT